MKLIEDCKRKWWKLYSVWFQGAVSAAVGALVMIPDAANSILNSLPPEMRAVVPAGATFALIALGILVRVIHQPKVTGNAANPPPTT